MIHERPTLRNYVDMRDMSLRDYFAAKIAQGHLASLDGGFIGSGKFNPLHFAGWCFSVADAMIAARGDK